MAKTAPAIVRPCLVLMAVFTILTGLVYPLLVTATAQMIFPDQAKGSLVREHGRIVGSQLIAQTSSGPAWFWPRPSAVDFHADNSGGSNLAPVVEPQYKIWAERVAALRASGVDGILPADLVTASGSGLDPQVSLAAALIQVPRIAAARQLDPERLRHLITEHLQPPQFGLLGASRVTVLELNLALMTLTGGDP